MRRICHLALSTLLIAVAAAPVHADVVSATFTGIWGGCSQCPKNLGVIHSGDVFSGAATWDTNGMGALLSFSFTMSAAEGLSFASIPTPQVLSAEASSGTHSNLHWIEQSTADNNIYDFNIAIPAEFKGANVFSPSLNPFNDFLTFSGRPYSTTGPTPVPEPSTIGFLAGGLGLMWLVRRRTRK